MSSCLFTDKVKSS